MQFAYLFGFLMVALIQTHCQADQVDHDAFYCKYKDKSQGFCLFSNSGEHLGSNTGSGGDTGPGGNRSSGRTRKVQLIKASPEGQGFSCDAAKLDEVNVHKEKPQCCYPTLKKDNIAFQMRFDDFRTSCTKPSATSDATPL
ncbi:hypothetical protein PGT21_009900 [Puccinia graminis f. sp. tritici]|uniref:Secreted protein n=1 Tax=Puccinia graminis f. sp. tritici TaxID=56615 RepID=A0A5B0NL20_PUCGR|nr:hypothetical protein PGT21_009900 [Puccinia graminis f. sp. tritici]